MEQVIEKTEAAQTGGQYLSFALGNEEYGIEILRVQEIKGYTTVTPIPNSPMHIKGAINLRGAVVPVVDLRSKFAMEAVEYTKFTVIVLVAVADKTVGLIVDAVSDVLNLADGQLQPPPDMGASLDVRFIRGMATVGEKLLSVLDIDKLLGEDVGAAYAG